MQVDPNLSVSDDFRSNFRIKLKNVNYFPSEGSQGSAGVNFFMPQPDTGLHCEIMDMGLVQLMVNLFTPTFAELLCLPRGMARLS